ncbi:MAG: hypothetical protein KKG60_03665 [Nanoarchaeota archaeon]|nr:hypothetical protein [Nanoarchaeota archaeon]
MVLKTFNLNENVYATFSQFYREHGMSMSKQVEFFMRSWIEKEPKAKKEYLGKLNIIRKQKSIRIGTINDLKKRYSM